MDDLFIPRFRYGVRYQQNLYAPHHSDGLPSQLSFHFSVLTGDVIGIIENQDRGLKANAVLPPVDTVLSLIPSKLQNGSLVMTFMSRHYRFSGL